ncbi:hypothetical protein LCGC14_2904400, partial [marine sediment metagenome]
MCDSSSEKCPQDGKYYIGKKNSACTFEYNDDYTYDPDTAKKCQNIDFNTNPNCPPGYHYVKPRDPCSQAKICATTTQQLCFGATCKTYPFYTWELTDICVGDEPTMDQNRKNLCCTGHPPTGSYYRNCATGYCPNNSTCASTMSDYCVQNGLDENCKNFFNVSTNITSKRIVAQALFDKYTQRDTDPRTNKHMDELTSLCSEFAPPGSCDQKLEQFCQNLTREQVNQSTSLKNLCGCFLAAKEYQEFKAVLKGAGALPNVCDPLCASSSTQKGDQNCNVDRCKSAICVVDLSNKDVQELVQKNIAINQICVSPKDGTAECYIAFTNMDRKELREKNITVNQNCGQCFLYDPNKAYKEGVNPLPVECDN